MKKILFLGGSHSQMPAIRYAKQKGLKVFLADYLENNPSRKYADKYFNISTTDIKKIYELAKRLNIDAISAYGSDPAALTASYVSDKLGLIGNPYKSVEILSFKNKFRKFLKKNDFKVPDFYFSNKLSELLDYYEKNYKYEYILKPVDSSGSKGVYIIKNKEDIIKNFEKSLNESRLKQVILEKYINRKGPQIHGEGFVEKGKLRFLCLGDQYFDLNQNIIPFSTIVPSIEHKDVMQECKILVGNVIKKSGFLNGGINIEIIRDIDDQLYVLEIGPRSGGNFMPNLIKYQTQFDLIKANIDILFNEKIDYKIKINENDNFAQIILHSNKSGYFKRISLPHELNTLMYQSLYYKIGDEIKKYENSRDVIGVNIVKVRKNILQKKNYSELLYKKNIIEIYDKNKVRIEYKNKNSKEILRYFILNKDVFFTDLENRINIIDYSQKLAKNANQIWLYFENDIKGFAAFYSNLNFGYLSTISIKKECQGKNFGKLLLKKIIEILIDKDIYRLQLEVEKENLKAINFYKKNKFKIVKENKNTFLMETNIKDYEN